MSNDAYLKRWSPELRRAVMKVRPEYFAWSRAQQERYAVDMPDDDEARIDQILLAELFDQTYDTPEKARRAVRDIPLGDLDRWNVARLPLLGIGEDNFFLNGFVPKDKTLLDYPTLRDYDEAQHEYQERARQEQQPDYEIHPYRGQLYLNHAWLYVDERFSYGLLSMAAGYIYSRLEALAHDAVKECIPWKYVESGPRWRRAGEHYQLDMRRDAGGQEALVDELEYLAIHHAFARFDALKEHWHQLGQRGVYIFEPEREFPFTKENELEFVFTDINALGPVRFSSFVRDCRAIARPAQELLQAVEEEETQMRAWVRAQHQDLLRTFDPKVAKLRKKKQVVFSAAAVEDLERITAEESSAVEDNEKS